jgi:hypothetical protein
MSDVLQHFYRVLQRHKVVVHLVESVPVRDDVLQEHIVEDSVPVNESAPGRSSAVHLPIADQRKPLVQNEDLVNLLHFEYRVLAQIQTMVYNRLPKRIISPLLAL